MRRKKKIDRTTALLRLQTMKRTDVQNPKRETLSSFTANLLAEEEAERAKKLEPARQKVAEYSRALQELIQEDLVAGLNVPSKFLAATTVQITDYSVFENTSPEALRASWRRALSEFEDGCNEGTFTESGRRKMLSLIAANRTTDWRESSSFAQTYVLLQHADALTEEDFVERPEIPEQSAQPESLDIENLDLGSRAGRAAAVPILMRGMQEECLVWWRAFTDSIRKNFNGYELTDEETQDFISELKRRNANWCDARSYDSVRVSMVKAGRLSNHLLYPSEKLDMLIEETDLTGPNAYQNKRELQRKERLLMNQ